MTLCVVVVLILVIFSSAAISDVPAAQVLDTGKLRVSFDSSEAKALLSEISIPGGRNFIVQPTDLLWRIALRSDDGGISEFASADATLVGVKSAPGKLTLTWRADNAMEVAVSIRAPKNSSVSYWSLKATMLDGRQVDRCDFPLMPTISSELGNKLAVPIGWGIQYNMTPGMTYQATSPSMSAAMQFVALYGVNDALYLGAHDPRANHKVFSVKAEEKTVEYNCQNWPGLAEKGGGEYKLPYEAVVGVVNGGWYEAAQLYREWALTAPWSKAGPISKRPIPQWLKDTDLWLRVEFGYEGIADFCKQAHEYFDVPTSLHWYKWHEIPYDTLYPDYFPTRPGFAEGVKELQSMGFHVMPYINGRIVDPNSKGWNEEGLSKSAARQENGDPYTEVYGSQVPLNSMCPYTTAWHDKVSYLVERLTHECGVNGVYIDQIGCAHAYRCYDRNHGHPLGGGHFWVDGYRTLLDKARAKLPKDRMFTTEENIECFIDKFDALLIVNTPCNSYSTVIPLFQAVYSGRAITFGFQYIGREDIQRSTPFRAKMAREFIFGAQMGWVLAEQLMQPEAEKERDFVRNLARCRGKAHKYLLEGRFLGLVDVKGDNPRVNFTAPAPFGGEYTLDMPSVFGSAWEAEDGSIAVALSNMSDEPRRVEFSVRGIDKVEKATVLKRNGAVIEMKGPNK